MTPPPIRYQTDLHQIEPAQLSGFFEGWPSPPDAPTLRRILEGSARFVLAVAPNGEVVGFVNAISDGVLCAYIPLLEVKAQWRGQGVATHLMQRLRDALGDLYMIDTSCDDGLVPFYERLGMQRGNAMVLRNYARQNGR